MTIFDRAFGTPLMAALKKGLEGAAIRQEAISNNIANVSTPGYKRQAVKFEDELWSALGGSGFHLTTTHPAHYNGGGQGIESIRPRLELDQESSIRIDGNTVNIDQEMVELAKNSGRFAQLAELLNRQYGQIKAALSGNMR